jgi:hypothetical protein
MFVSITDDIYTKIRKKKKENLNQVQSPLLVHFENCLFFKIYKRSLERDGSWLLSNMLHNIVHSVLYCNHSRGHSFLIRYLRMLWTAVLSLENHPLYPVAVYTNNVHYKMNVASSPYFFRESHKRDSIGCPIPVLLLLSSILLGFFLSV